MPRVGGLGGPEGGAIPLGKVDGPGANTYIVYINI